MTKHCSYCGIPVGDQAACHLCGTRVVAVNLRRTLMLGLLVEECLLVIVLMLR